MSLQTVHVVVKGKVQGVFFRTEARERAQKLDVTGWVRNIQDGAVELMAQGQASNLSQFLSWCRKGPPEANVNEIQINYIEVKEDLTGFNIQ